METAKTPTPTQKDTLASYLQLPVVLPHGRQEAVILLSLVCFEAQVSLQALLLSLQMLHTFIIIIVIFIVSAFVAA